ncbi:MAG: HlyD family efflux transporter periplasmic adaptor subunit [Archangium sp.]|nr:HlyD family efflux transporter periplasmic adaptor subunit [Archangium sp.]
MASRRDKTLVYEATSVPWATDEFVRERPRVFIRGFVYVLLASLALLVAYGAWATIAISISARGGLVSEQPPVPIRLKTSIRIGELLVKESQVVHQGDVLVVADDQLTEDEHTRLRGDLQQALLVATALRKGACTDCTVRVEKLAQNGFVTENQGGIRETLVGVQDLFKDLATSVQQLARLPEMTAEARRRIAVASAKIAEIRRRHAEEMLAPQLEQLGNEVSSAKSLIYDRQQSLQSAVDRTLDRLEVRLASLGPTLDQFRAQQKAVAPIDGVVTQIKVSGRGELVGAGSDLLQLVPLNSPLVAELNIANKDIAEVREGMPVVVKLEALPERQFGVARGVVESVPATGLAAKDSGQIMYPVRVRLETQAFQRGGTVYPFRLGMALEGLVVTRHESVLSVAVRKLLNVGDELVRN